MKDTTERKLRRIQQRVYAKYKPKLWKEQPKADAILEVMEKALADNPKKSDDDPTKLDDVTMEKLQAIRDSKILDGMETVVDEEVAHEYELEVEKEIGKAIASGKLPHPDEDPEVLAFKNRNKK